MVADGKVISVLEPKKMSKASPSHLVLVNDLACNALAFAMIQGAISVVYRYHVDMKAKKEADDPLR
jgi:hypothetical protein